MVHASPTFYRADLDGTKIETLRQQFIGETRGLRYLSALLADREIELREKLEQQKQQEKDQ